MIGRLLISVGIFLTGYYLGKQMGITEHIRKDLAEKRNQKQLADESKEPTVEKEKPARKRQGQVT